MTPTNEQVVDKSAPRHGDYTICSSAPLDNVRIRHIDKSMPALRGVN